MRTILLGPPGAGKGTQAERLVASTAWRHIDTGDLVRQEIAAGTPIGRTLRGYSDRGELVPDRLIIDLVAPYIAAPSWILDGFPRDEAQARALDARLAAYGGQVDCVIALEIADEDLVARMQHRRISDTTGKIYNLRFDPHPKTTPGHSSSVLMTIPRRSGAALRCITRVRSRCWHTTRRAGCCSASTPVDRPRKSRNGSLWHCMALRAAGAAMTR